LLCIGDAAHAMSPIGGVGINLAIQDAVAAARILAGPLRHHAVRPSELAKIQRRRWLPTAIIQGAQRIAHWAFARNARRSEPASTSADRLPPFVRLMRRYRFLQVIPAYLVGVGPLPEHAPDFARRPRPLRPTRRRS
jgi:2-polyprenyl-6-methoxyphenol hydroxylase-like FAD-dependent oxidoreductase